MRYEETFLWSPERGIQFLKSRRVIGMFVAFLNVISGGALLSIQDILGSLFFLSRKPNAEL